MTEIDETAKTILATEAPQINSDSRFNDLAQKYVANQHTHLQAMARFWLMKQELVAFLTDLEEHDKTESWAYNIAKDLLTKLRR